MYKKQDFDKPFYKTGYVAKLVGLHARTIQSYCDSGKLESIRTDTGLRLITRSSVLDFLKSLHLLQEDRDTAIYTTDANVTGYDRVYLASEQGLEELLSDLLDNKLDEVTFTDETLAGPFADIIKQISKEHDVSIKGENRG